jgi:endonuclease/exonuclease/phosphatase family metal-dependent hydrolase
MPVPTPESPTQRRRVSLLSANIQAGASTRGYRDYVTRPWNHVLPHREKRNNLDALGDLATQFDLVGLQETDPGSLRSGFLNQTHYLAERGGFPFWSHQPNRRVGRIASSANGLLSKLEPDEVLDYALPSRIPGRGVLLARYGKDANAVTVAIAHLSLSPRARARTAGVPRRTAVGPRHAVLMGDFNCECDAAEMEHCSTARRHCVRPSERVLTFPSWQPRARSTTSWCPTASTCGAAGCCRDSSDHLALAAELTMPIDWQA